LKRTKRERRKETKSLCLSVCKKERENEFLFETLARRLFFLFLLFNCRFVPMPLLAALAALSERTGEAPFVFVAVSPPIYQAPSPPPPLQLEGREEERQSSAAECSCVVVVVVVVVLVVLVVVVVVVGSA
jgi:hypothetical protein